ncbi:uncharacterized protein LOC112603695 isoform X2 [Melanaphis sacchari]|uniref:uncharacterized protein LOC112597021 n=1 Tax=Melanaphis sacchari TaxID=742174 RepID=UPI000DC1531F|nr:uncharacterized protein LOC112594273 isoform X2 [Melanaphis sacchari]XP_025198714.1 uncharacterized protein LOC112597021 [Melanaphis sacchari]XP_025208174.1 uncharacterized protein LOC112603695 isoform X2 [Melanaphis sacchari]
MIVTDLKTKWRHIRDHYSKFINQGKSGDSAKKKKYVYAESLSFLQHVIKKRRTTGNFDENVHEEGEGENISGEDSSHELEIYDETIPAQSDRYSTPKSKKQNKCKVQKITQFQRELLKNLSTSEEDVTSDPDKAFLFSLLPDYKRLNYEQKTDFRLMTLQYFRNISLGSNQLQPTPPSYNINQNTTRIPPIQTQYSNVYSSEFNPGLGYNQNHNLMPQRPQPLPYTSSYNYTSDQSQQPNTSGEMYGNFDIINK